MDMGQTRNINGVREEVMLTFKYVQCAIYKRVKLFYSLNLGGHIVLQVRIKLRNSSLYSLLI